MSTSVMYIKKMRPASTSSVIGFVCILIGGPGLLWGQRPGPVKPFTRLADGKPDMQGYWETANFFSAFDLETHERAEFGVPAGKGVIVDPVDGKIPYQPWALEKKKDLSEHHLFED